MTSPAEHPKQLKSATNFREWVLALGVSLGAALVVIAPFFWLGNASGHDFGFHAASWLDAASQWREGIAYPRWTEWANHGFGEPRFLFYPPLSWMLGAALGFLAPWNAVPGIFVALVQTIAGLGSYALARRFARRGAALFGAAAYAVNPYALLVIYMRSDFAELLACALLPILVLAGLQICGLAEKRGTPQPRVTAYFAVAFALVWVSNAPAAVIASYSVALFFVWAAFGEKSFRPLWRGVAGATLGLALASFYLFPAAYEQRWVNITQALSPGLQPSDNFIYTMTGDPEHTVFNWIASTVAIVLMVMTGIAALAARRRAAHGEGTEEARKLWRVLLFLSAAAIFMMIRPSSVFWEHLFKLRFVQFPWRWMSILALPYSCFLAAAMTRRRAGWILGAAVIAVSAATGAFLVQQTWWDSGDIPDLREAIANDQGFEGTDEYDPLGDDHTNLPEKAPRVEILPGAERGGSAPRAEVQFLRWSAEERDLQVSSDSPVRVALRLLDYPAWHVEVNGRVATPGHRETSGQMILPLAAGKQHIAVKLVRTPDRILGIFVSVSGLLALLTLFNAGGQRLLSASP
jgi:ABC-type proline/glycine betaine transport system permease subunit